MESRLSATAANVFDGPAELIISAERARGVRRTSSQQFV
ncbi:hypothetical protein NJ7G_1542 [Natrinema sp. J7-2]|nr:hypothetical protein NJ7G_1542 [Natrinema sp. J7-2]